ncbi:50S ribosomal protein L3 [Candidatus Pacearchaeota archaeon]|nr:50S ribosomal protein L3 [Candidatus Pacearchaeota archaeon]
MAKLSRPRRGSLQYWPRKRAKKIIPSVNWEAISLKNQDKKILGFICYKVGMMSAYAKDNTPDSMTKNKRIVFPVTILECPPLKIFSVRFYKNKKTLTEILSSNIYVDKEVKKLVKISKTDNKTQKKLDTIKDYDDIRIIVYSTISKTGLKHKPDVIELAISGNLDEKLIFVKEHLNKEIKISEVFGKMQMVDIHAVTKGKGYQGAVKRFGIGLRQHKAEKGVRRPGSLGPWHPARVTFRTPQSGQLGFFTRVAYNNKIIDFGNISEKNINPSSGFKHFGNIKTDYIVLRGSVHGVVKRPIIITHTLRKTKYQEKKNFDLIELR